MISSLVIHQSNINFSIAMCGGAQRASISRRAMLP